MKCLSERLILSRIHFVTKLIFGFQVERLSDIVESKEDRCSSLQSKISNLESNLEKEKMKVRELDDKLVAEKEMNSTLQYQVRDDTNKFRVN